jgi:integrase
MHKPKPLTAAFLRHVKLPSSGQVEIADGGCPGLRLRLSTTVATWVLCCRDIAGRMRRFTLGGFPAMGLKDARDEARRLRQEIRQGKDPIKDRREGRKAAQDAYGADSTVLTLARLLDAYAAVPANRKRSWARRRRMIENVFAAKLDRAVMKLTASELQLAIDSYGSIMSAASAVRSLKPILKWGTKRALVGTGVAEALEPPDGSRRSRDRVLARDEIRMVLNALDVVPEGYAQATRMLFWSAARLGDVCAMRRGDVDLATGVWSLVQIKTGELNVIPLPRQALAMLQACCEGLSADALVFTNTEGRRMQNWHLATRRIQQASDTTGWHRHDIRRTVATIMGDLGTPPHVIETALGHKLRTSADGSPVSRIAQVYNRSRYRPEHADALQRLADELDRIRTGEDADKIVRLRA